MGATHGNSCGVPSDLKQQTSPLFFPHTTHCELALLILLMGSIFDEKAQLQTCKFGDYMQKRRMAPSSDACNACGTGNGAICCFNADGSIIEGPCGTDGSFCSKQSTSNYCMTSTGEFGTACAKKGDPCAMDNLSCQKDPNDQTLKCLCKEDFKPCTSDGSKMCDPGGGGPSPSGKFTNACSGDQKGQCAQGQYSCYDGKDKGQCNQNQPYFQNDQNCAHFCQV